MRIKLVFICTTAALATAGVASAQSFAPYGPPSHSRAVVVPPPPPPSYAARVAPGKPAAPRTKPAPLRPPREDRS